MKKVRLIEETGKCRRADQESVRAVFGVREPGSREFDRSQLRDRECGGRATALQGRRADIA